MSAAALTMIGPDANQGAAGMPSPSLPASPSRAEKVVGMRAIATILDVPVAVAITWRAHGLPVKQGEKRRATDDKRPDKRLSARVVDLLEWRKAHPELEPPLRRLRAYRLANPDVYPEEVRVRLRALIDDPPDVATEIAPQVSLKDAWINAMRAAPRVTDSLASFAAKLASHAKDKTGLIERLSIAWFAHKWGIDERTVQSRCRELEALGVLQIEELFRAVPKGPRTQPDDVMDLAYFRPHLANRYTLRLNAAIMRRIGLRVDDRVIEHLRERGLEPYESDPNRSERADAKAPPKKRGGVPRRVEAPRATGEASRATGEAGEAHHDAGEAEAEEAHPDASDASRPTGEAGGTHATGASRPAGEAGETHAARHVEGGTTPPSGELPGATAAPDQLDDTECLLLEELAAHPAWHPFATPHRARELNQVRLAARKDIGQALAAIANCGRLRASDPPAQRWAALTVRFLPVQDPVRAEDIVQRTLVALAPLAAVAEDFAYANQLVLAWRKTGRGGDDLAPLLVLLREAARTAPASDGQLPAVTAIRTHIKETVLGRTTAPRTEEIHGSKCSPRRCHCWIRNENVGIFANPDP